MKLCFPPFAGLFASGVLLLSLLACQSSQSARQPTEPVADAPQGQLIEATPLDQGTHCAIMQRRNLRIQTPEAFTELWREAFSDRYPQPEAPRVDFERYEVLACFLGTCNNGGHRLRLDGVRLYDETLQTTLTHLAPGPTCMTTDALTYPYVLVRIPRQEATEVSFTLNKEIDAC